MDFFLAISTFLLNQFWLENDGFSAQRKIKQCLQSCPLSSLNVIGLNTNHYEADDEPNKPKGTDKNDHDLHGAQIEEGRPEEDIKVLQNKSK